LIFGLDLALIDLAGFFAADSTRHYRLWAKVADFSIDFGWRRHKNSTTSPEISCTAQNANILERRLPVGFALAMTMKAD
jgi:hypothetical protein